MKAIEVVTLLANKDTEFFNALHSYCEQERTFLACLLYQNKIIHEVSYC